MMLSQSMRSLNEGVFKVKQVQWRRKVQFLAILQSLGYTFFANFLLRKVGKCPLFYFWGQKMTQDESDTKESLEARIAALAEQTAAAIGMEVVLVEIMGGGNRSIVRVFIDQPGGVSLDDCERFSKRLSVLLDVEDWIPFSYVLEVSSPGLDRPLINEMDFQRFAGRNAKIRTRLPLEGQRNFKGKILRTGQGRVIIELGQGKQVEISMAEIEKANLVAEL
jgi:ribosome maturation factor RimP